MYISTTQGICRVNIKEKHVTGVILNYLLIPITSFDIKNLCKIHSQNLSVEGEINACVSVI
jgi:hypothetical protein